MFFKYYVDHIFALFSSPVNAKEFKEYLPSKYPNIHFSEEKKKGDCLPYSDFKIFGENGRFVPIFIKKDLQRRDTTTKVLNLKHKKCFCFLFKILSGS